MRKTITLIYFLFLFLSTSHVVAAPLSRPEIKKGPTRILVDIYILDIDEINTANQSYDANVLFEVTWFDPRLKHKEEGSVRMSVENIWHPKLQIVNRQRIWTSLSHTVEVTPEGKVIYSQRVWGTFSQPLALEEFPFDQQTFRLQLSSVGYGPDELELTRGTVSGSGIADKLSVADWRLISWQLNAEPFLPSPGSLPAAGYAITFDAERKSGYFVVKVIIPLILIVMMSWLVFWIDPKEAGTQISVGITSMLTLIAYRFAVDTSLPRVSYLTRLDYFILAGTFLVFASLIEVMVTSALTKKGHYKRALTIDYVARLLFPLAFFLISMDALMWEGIFR
jgi:hypothetical protein